ncbi:MAG TPA: hypothetical protein VIU12_33055 [Chryseolinea sp.]
MRSLIIGLITTLILAAIQAYRTRKGKQQNSTALLQAGKLLYPDHQQAFEDFYNLFVTDKKKFVAEKKSILENYFFENDELRPIDIVYIFGDQNKKLVFTDWRGEENTREIEEFMAQNLNISPTWTQTDKIRATETEKNQRDGKYIMAILHAMDQDLGAIGKQLIFVYLGWDAYAYTVVDKATFKKIMELAPNDFHGTERVK